jgi:uncharacterized protein (DUF983 family)
MKSDGHGGVIVCPSCGNVRLFVAVSPDEIQCQDCRYVFPNHFADSNDKLEGESDG